MKSTGNATKLRFALNDAAVEMTGWTDRLKAITQRDYYTGYNPPSSNYSLFTKLCIKSKRGQLSMIRVDFEG